MIKQKLLLLGFAILGIGGFIYYKQVSHISNQIIDFIPNNTLILLETNEISTIENAVIPRIPLLTNASSQYQILKSIGLTQKNIDLLITKKTLYFALLPEGRDSFAFVNYLPLTSDNEDFIEKLSELSYNNNTGKRIIPHTTNGFKVLEVINEQAKPLFSYIIKDNIFIFSQSNLVLEESIIHSENSWIKTIKLHDSYPKSDLIFTQTHFNRNAINNFLKDISVKNSINFSSILPETLEWLKPSANALEGINTKSNFDFFEGQKSSNIQSLNMIPNFCSYALIMSFSNQEKFTNNLEKKIENKKIIALREKVNEKFKVEFSEFYNKINKEFILCNFDNLDQSLQNKVLIIKQKGLMNPLKAISNYVATKSQEAVFSVQYGSFLITSLGIKEFPMMLFGEIYTGFEECYFTEYNDYIIMASSLAMMQEYLISISKGEVWSNSPKIKKILKHCLPANLTLIAENSKALKGLQNVLNNKWSSNIDAHINVLSSIQAEILQLNSTDGRLVLLKNIEISKTIQKSSNKWIKLGGINVTNTSRPLYLVNPQNKNTQILIQGNDNNLILFENGKRVWHLKLNGKLVGEIKSIKYAKTASQELIAVTKSKIFILTRKEKGFEVIESKPFKGFSLENFNVFENENDNDKNLTLVSKNGESYKFNKQTLTLIQYHIRSSTIQTLIPMPNIIQKGIEYVVILDKTGKLFLQNAKGNFASNFPIKINGNFTSPPLLEGYNNNVVMRMISEQGDLYKISLEGKILEKRQLFRPNNEVKFSMATDERNTDWVIMRTDGKEVAVLDKNEKEMFVIKELNYGKKILGYYNLGIGGKYFSVNNGFESYRFFNENGNEIGQIQIESNFKPSLSYSDSYKKIIMNITTPSSIETWSVKIH